MSERKLCDWDRKRIEKKREKLVRIVSSPEYVCEKCARAASEKGYLCKPTSIR